MADARLSDRELAQINAAAVTREYTVKPHLGMFIILHVSSVIQSFSKTIELFLLSMGVFTFYLCL